MAKRVKRSQEDLLDSAARLVAGTINPEAMGLDVEDIELDEFIKLFIKKAREMLENKDALTLSIGEYLNTEGNEVFSPDLKTIIEFIDKESKQSYRFLKGILVYLTHEDLGVSWNPERLS